jgi:hypothetical protein
MNSPHSNAESESPENATTSSFFEAAQASASATAASASPSLFNILLIYINKK